MVCKILDYNRAIRYNTFLGLWKVTWENEGFIPLTEIKATHQASIVGVLHSINLFDFDVESGTLCWGSTDGCYVKCQSRKGNVFTIWDEQFLFSRNKGQTNAMSDFDYTRCPEVMTLAPGGLLYIISRSRYTHGNLDRDFSTVVVFADNVYRHGWEPSLVDDFEEEDQFYPEYLIFANRTERPHTIDENMIIVEVSDKTKRIRIGQGDADTSSLRNTMKFSISEGQVILDVRPRESEIWIQADNKRMTILEPTHDNTKFTWKQVIDSIKNILVSNHSSDLLK